MKQCKKFLIILVGINLLLGLIYLNQFEANATDLSNMESQASSFIEAGANQAGDVASNITSNFVGLGQILTMIGAGVMVAVVSYMGINYIMAPPDKQAALKQQLVGVVVAGIVIFGAYGIWRAVLNVVSQF